MPAKQGALTAQDTWGRDPAVRRMRRVFEAMERRQQDLLRHLNLSLLDPRLRSWRERALALFDDAWTGRSRQGISMNEQMAGELYVEGMIKILQTDGIDVPEPLPDVDAPVDRSEREEDV